FLQRSAHGPERGDEALDLLGPVLRTDRRELQAHDFDVDSDLGPEDAHCFSDVRQFRHPWQSVGSVHLQLETVGVSGLLQQIFRCLGIVAVFLFPPIFPFRVPAGQSVVVAMHQHGCPAMPEDEFVNLVPADGFVHGFTHQATVLAGLGVRHCGIVGLIASCVILAAHYEPGEYGAQTALGDTHAL
ncbi:hypothetical protein GBAR_LOCUS4832, partial [Geodia barretti]